METPKYRKWNVKRAGIRAHEVEWSQKQSTDGKSGCADSGNANKVNAAVLIHLHLTVSVCFDYVEFKVSLSQRTVTVVSQW